MLLEENPLEDIANTRRIHVVLLRGRLLERADLDALLAEVEGACCTMPSDQVLGKAH